MAIEKVKRAWFLVERPELDPFLKALAATRTTHVVDLKVEAAPPPDSPLALVPPATTQAETADQVHKLARVLDTIDSVIPPRQSFAQKFVSLPTEMTRAEFERSVAEIDPDALHERAMAAGRARAHAIREADRLRADIARLLPWADAIAPPAGLNRITADLGTVPAKVLPALIDAARQLPGLALEPVLRTRNHALVAAAWLNDAATDAGRLMHAHGFSSLRLPHGAGPVADVIDRLRSALEAASAELAAQNDAFAELVGGRRAILAALAHRQAEAEREAASGKALAARRIAVLSGYVRLRDLPAIDTVLARDFPGVTLIADDPRPDENVPVSLGGSKLFEPAQFLTAMFGLPDYFSFDPSPYIFFTFLLFFGLCFGDAIYGLALFLLGWWIAHKARAYPSTAKFFRLLASAGAVAIFFGVITGSWASDLLTGDYLGKGNPVSAWLKSIALTDPLAKPMIGLGVAVGIGVLNQFYGITLLIYRELRKGNPLAAFLDGGLWLVFLPALIILAVGAGGLLPPAWTSVALVIVGVCAVALVLTQGRKEKTFVGKAITGLVSLYGILGSYGTMSFVGDTLSYTRLLALGLTTTVVGMAFNFIAGLLGSVPVVGILLFILVAATSHAYNFLASILGGFVHSARLIFVEFFSRFYEGGARPFAPLGLPQTVRIIDNHS